MEVGEVPKGIRWSAEAGGPPNVRIGGVSGRGRCPTLCLKVLLSSHILDDIKRSQLFKDLILSS